MKVEEHYEKLYRYCYFHIRDPVSAEDLTQEVFLRYFHRNPDLDKGKELAYLYAIARNLCADYFRSKQEEPFWQVPFHNPIEAVEEQADLGEAVKLLDRESQELLLLRYGEDYSAKETGKILGISRFAVYRRERAAIGKLKEILEGRGSFEQKE